MFLIPLFGISPATLRLRYPHPLMLFTLAHVGPRFGPRDPLDPPTRVYLDRIPPFASTKAEAFKSESAFLDWLDRQKGREPAFPTLLDSRGKQMTSEAFAAWIGSRRDQGVRHLVFAIGPADGWSPTALARAQFLLSLGTFTLAHALARLVLAEQLYRATTILTGHPYHSGH
jgi:23S rRNA (pseudouridine1915-N3)-methyltransferase